VSDTKARAPNFLIEVARTTSGGARPEMAVDTIIDGTRETLEAVASILETSCQAFVQKIGELSAKPSEITIEFGVDATGEAGIPLITKGSLGANFKVGLKWSWSK